MSSYREAGGMARVSGRAVLILGALALIGGYNMNRREEAAKVLARTIYGEARGEGRQGMHAVANVIINRTLVGGWWGDDVISVALKPWQFSAWNENDPNRAVIADLEPGDNPTFDVAYEIAWAALNGNLPDITGGATHYHTHAVSPAWRDPNKVTATIRGHVFYRGIA